MHIVVCRISRDNNNLGYYMSGAKVVFDIRGCRIKLSCLHPTQSWIGIITASNVFELWNYESKILLKAFNCITLDDMKPIDIKDIIFFDKSSSKPLSTVHKESLIQKKSNKNWIIFASERKLFFYDYCTDVNRTIPEKELDSKLIRKVEQISDEAVCVGASDGSLKIIDVNHLATIKTIKGYYSKPITWIIAYKQSEYERPRVIAASSDSSMACWNIDSNVETPSFKFLMKKKSLLDNTSNDGQQIISLKYERSTFRLLTITQQYVTVWSTFSGHELRRLKNVNGLRDIDFFSQLNYPVDSFLSHSRGEDIYISTVLLDIKHAGSSVPNFQAHNLINLRGIFNDNGATKLVSISVLPAQPWILCLNTTSGIFLLEVNRVVTETICFNDLFSTRLSISNSRQFYADQVLNQAAVIPSRINTLYLKQSQSFHFFYLSNQRNCIIFKLVELKLSDMSFMTSQFILMDLHHLPLLNERLEIKVSFDGKLIALVSLVTSYCEIYMVDNPKGFGEVDSGNRVDFYSKFRRVFEGMCADFQWHQYKNQFAIIAPVSKGVFVNYKKTAKGMDLDAKIEGYQFVIFQLKHEQFQIFFKKPIDTKIKKCFSGPFFSCSTKPLTLQPDTILTKDQERIEFIETCQGTVKVFDPFIHTPEQIYWNYCGTIMITCYDSYFVIFKVGQDGLMGYLRKVEKCIINGYFWEKLFFFVTSSTIECIQIINTQVIQIVIAVNNPSTSDSSPQFDIFDPLYLDTIDVPPLEKPIGHLKIMGIMNLHLSLVNQVGSLSFITLQQNPYLIFVMEIISNSFKYSKFIYEHCDDRILPMLDDVIKQYGVLHTDFLTK